MLSLADVIAEATKALAFPGGIAEFYVVTSGDRDAALQSQVRAHFRANPAPFDVEVIFWPDIVADLSGDPALVGKHWHGFAQPGPSGLAPPRWIGRHEVNANETTESHIEFAMRLIDQVELDATELRVALERQVCTEPSDYVVRSLLEKTPTFEGAISIWARTHRPYSNVVDKWELEIGDGGHVVRRWSKFTTHGHVYLETYELFNHVVLPIYKYALAIASWSSSVGRKNLPMRMLLRLSYKSTHAPLLEDNVKLFGDVRRWSAPISPEQWDVTLEEDLSVGPRRLALRFLNRAVAKFVEQPSAWLGENHRPGLVQVNDAAFSQLLAKSGL